MKEESELNQDDEGLEKINHNILAKFFLYIKSFLPFLLSHHPECENFEGHSLKCGRFKLCIGCFIGYPTAILAFLTIKIINLSELFSSQVFLILSIVFLGTIFLSPLKLTENKRIKITQKFLIGLGTALLFNWIMERPYSRSKNLTTSFIVSYILLTILNVYHAYGILSNCFKCETPFNWGICPGFCEIRERMRENKIDNFLIKFENLSYKLLERRAKKNKH